jgi:hypothetical protein
MYIDLTKIPEERRTDWTKELLRRGWVWLLAEDDQAKGYDKAAK